MCAFKKKKKCLLNNMGFPQVLPGRCLAVCSCSSVNVQTEEGIGEREKGIERTNLVILYEGWSI